MRTLLLLGLLLLALSGCQQGSLRELADSLNARGVSHCLAITGTFPPYGHAILHAKVGDLDCVEVWREIRALNGP
jgi:hypothetical protein